MAVPKRVQEQKDEAERIQQRIIDKKAGKPDLVVADPPAAPANADPGTDWEKRFKGLQVTHGQAVEQIAEISDANKALQQDVAELKALIKVEPDPLPAAQVAAFTDAEVKEYGQTFLDMIGRVATAAAAPDSITSELNEVKDRLNGFVETQYQTAEETYFAILDKEMPDWEKINKDEGFKAWLAELMPLTKQQRQVFLEKSHKNHDAYAVLEFFRAWKGESGQGYTPQSHTTNGEFVEEVVDTDTYRPADIKRFYDEKAKGLWNGREDEARQIELRIFKAQKEGRIR
jgi:hypothetical protein